MLEKASWGLLLCSPDMVLSGKEMRERTCIEQRPYMSLTVSQSS